MTDKSMMVRTTVIAREASTQAWLYVAEAENFDRQIAKQLSDLNSVMKRCS